MSNGAPSCAISFGQPIPGARVFQRGDPWSRPGALHDAINRIPRAHDLASAINALNIMNNIIMEINRGEPMVNNTYPDGKPSVILKGDDNNPHYQPIDWVLEGREYNVQHLKNPDNEDQSIEISTLRVVYFYNANTDYRLNYYGEGAI